MRDNGDAGSIVGYQNKDGSREHAWTGDASFAFVKDPPDLTLAAEWRSAFQALDAPATPAPQVLPLAAAPADLEALEPVDVAGYRTLNLMIEFYALGADDPAVEVQLYAMLLAGFQLPQNLYSSRETTPDRILFAPIGMVDPTVRGTDAAPLSLDAPCVSFRNTYASQFNMRAMTAAAFDPAAPCALTLVFDVAPYSHVRLDLGASNATSTAGVLYTLGR